MMKFIASKLRKPAFWGEFLARRPGGPDSVTSLLVVDQHDNGIPVAFGVIPSAEGKEDVQGFIQDVEDLAGRSSAGPRAAGVPPLAPRGRTRPAETGIGAGTAGMAAVQLEEEEDYFVIVE
ncbi:hypothetical protein VOLCADRAFT_108054 [Volvox carteri f. nagariensis]|uniref:Uncharacterized protein n=1 Tax=Volvox carteri f. nagariensis TaxID=3068 RepID=D8UHZ5_VOLCA|nr:uncharacterized protein VOLCADRAFT_108054 [Volvox carteri f. nagariensis]EFJ40666.1 hypothetical protein VOLCADRAFT_108054 [Volvox carteri f. nagariensis]|eukprot:XP_002958292.1 hypothetical protein VOLCADRAFT_108054 [Volvox carteri f. nagariensis]